MSDKIYTAIIIFSDTLTPDQISSYLDMKCDKSRLKGETIQPSIIRAKRNTWVLYSRITRNNPLPNHIEDLLDRVLPVIEKIRNLADKPDVEVAFYCVAYTDNRPAMFFTREQVATVCEMGAKIDIDLYIMPEEEEA